MSQSSLISMVGWVGLPQGRPVGYSGYANPIQFTTREIGVSSGE
ncbi:TPA: ash family protein [Yersinia enterocolitica]|nr:ash family protein [Yersinia aldovae]HDL6968803.1 ash family protein [Yersinia enterocolitica]HDL6972913.1 ash family protein [Yersinia enterocolitica]HDL6976063.1 ash family protein [Yersinia enterocolitica]HDL6989479.1 ash family protein [Yersinia enterocolitica]HDL6998156.1 ash family protein [Yersinia enterocolitica]